MKKVIYIFGHKSRLSYVRIKLIAVVRGRAVVKQDVEMYERQRYKVKIKQDGWMVGKVSQGCLSVDE